LPIWLTEWACPAAWDPLAYMRAVLPQLSQHHVARQAWFATRTTAWPDYAPLVAGDGTLTELGREYGLHN
ncbi:MAG: glycosyl hydrolase, partial [Pseudomonadota bacterium]